MPQTAGPDPQATPPLPGDPAAAEFSRRNFRVDRLIAGIAPSIVIELAPERYLFVNDASRGIGPGTIEVTAFDRGALEAKIPIPTMGPTEVLAFPGVPELLFAQSHSEEFARYWVTEKVHHYLPIESPKADGESIEFSFASICATARGKVVALDADRYNLVVWQVGGSPTLIELPKKYVNATLNGAFGSDADLYVCLQGDMREARTTVFQVQSNRLEPIGSFTAKDLPRMAATPDASLIIAAENAHAVAPLAIEIRRRDQHSGYFKPERSIELGDTRCEFLQLSPDGTWLAVVSSQWKVGSKARDPERRLRIFSLVNRTSDEPLFELPLDSRASCLAARDNRSLFLGLGEGRDRRLELIAF